MWLASSRPPPLWGKSVEIILRMRPESNLNRKTCDRYAISLTVFDCQGTRRPAYAPGTRHFRRLVYCPGEPQFTTTITYPPATSPLGSLSALLCSDAGGVLARRLIHTGIFDRLRTLKLRRRPGGERSWPQGESRHKDPHLPKPVLVCGWSLAPIGIRRGVAASIGRGRTNISLAVDFPAQA